MSDIEALSIDERTLYSIKLGEIIWISGSAVVCSEVGIFPPSIDKAPKEVQRELGEFPDEPVVTRGTHYVATT